MLGFFMRYRDRPMCLPNGCAVVFLGRTHRFAPTAFPRLWFRFSRIVGADRCVCPMKPRTVSSRRSLRRGIS